MQSMEVEIPNKHNVPSSSVDKTEAQSHSHGHGHEHTPNTAGCPHTRRAKLMKSMTKKFKND
jgi:hypothetical protein